MPRIPSHTERDEEMGNTRRTPGAGPLTDTYIDEDEFDDPDEDDFDDDDDDDEWED